jgi:hypothetical protein
MPDQTFDVTFANLCGKGAKVSAYDPLRDQATAVSLLTGDEKTTSVRMAVSDAPRFLVVEEAQAGPLVADVKIRTLPAGGAELRFTPTTDGTATVTWGPIPERRRVEVQGEWTAGKLLGEYFKGNSFRGTDLVIRRMDDPVDFTWKESPAPGVKPDFGVRWTGFVTPAFSEEYTFTTVADDRAGIHGVHLWIGNTLIVDAWPKSPTWVSGHAPARVSGTVKLEAGKAVPIRLEFKDAGGEAVIQLCWKSASQTEETVSASALSPPAAEPFGSAKPWSGPVKAGKPVTVPLPNAQPDDAVQIELASGPLTSRWPMWPWDVRGVIRFAVNAATPASATAVAPALSSLPALPDGAAPKTFAFAPPTGQKWTGTALRQETSFGAGDSAVQVVLERVKAKPEEVLPSTSTIDRVRITPGVWGKAPAWTVAAELEPVAHPGEKKFGRWLKLCPLADGSVLVLRAEAATPVALEAQKKALDDAAEAVKFE